MSLSGTSFYRARIWARPRCTLVQCHVHCAKRGYCDFDGYKWLLRLHVVRPSVCLSVRVTLMMMMMMMMTDELVSCHKVQGTGIVC